VQIHEQLRTAKAAKSAKKNGLMFSEKKHPASDSSALPTSAIRRQ
jgi:hypothetical protein